MLLVCSFEGLKVCSATERHFNALFMRNDLQHCIVSPSRTLIGLLVTGSTVMLGEEAEEMQFGWMNLVIIRRRAVFTLLEPADNTLSQTYHF